MSMPDEYYVIMPPGALTDIRAMLQGKTANGITEKSRRQVNKYLKHNGEWTDENQFKKNRQRKFTVWDVDGVDRVIVERDE